MYPIIHLELLQCGASASNARSVCEPCPGGSRLECSDVTHNCFAGITGCKNSIADPSNDASANSSTIEPSVVIHEDGFAAPSRLPSESEQAVEVQFQPTHTPSPSPEFMPNMTHAYTNNDLFFVSDSSLSVYSEIFYVNPFHHTCAQFMHIFYLRTHLFIQCGASASNAAIVCEPCPGGSSSECSDVTHNCFAGITGCSITSAIPSPMPSSPTELILVQSVEPTMQDGFEATSRSPSESGQEYGAISAEPSATIDEGEGMDGITMYQNPSGNTFFCGETFAKITIKCLMSKPCPSGVGSDYCADNEGCFSVPVCTAQYESAANASSPPTPTMSPKTSMPPINTPSSLVCPCLCFSSCSNVLAFLHHVTHPLFSTCYR